MPSKKDVVNNKKDKKPPIKNPSGLYEFANDQLGENRETRYEELGTEERNKQMGGKKKK